ncbi:MAG: hypothetical protein ACJ74H_02015 [Thermoanaerobaculia bacterium]
MPEPLTAGGVWGLTTIGLPSTQLSAASAALFVVVFAFLESGGAEQNLFILPWPGTATIAAIAAILSWTIAIRCRRRPGRVWPRAWALFLASANTATVAAAIVFRDQSSVLALAVAGLAASAALAPRLLKLRPDSPLIQRVAPLSMVVIAVAILPSTCAARRTIVKRTESRIGSQIHQFRRWADEVREITGRDWKRLEDEPEAAAEAVGNLKTLHFQGVTDDVSMWRAATLLGKDTELATAMMQLSDEVVAGLAPERIPRVSTFREPAVRWDGVTRRWVAYSRFQALSEITGDYHRELGRLYEELESGELSELHPKLADYQQHYKSNSALLKTYLNATAGTWADNWSAFRAPVKLTGRARPTLHDLLRAPILRNEAGEFAPGDLSRLMALPLDHLKGLAAGSPGCEGGLEAGNQFRVPGCRCANYDERQREYYRLDCYSYAPAETGTGAELRIEMRLVYESAPNRRLSGWNVPSEIYFHFLIPGGQNKDQYPEIVMTDLSRAAREQDLDRVSVVPWTRNTSAASGFGVITSYEKLRVLRPTIETLEGLTPEATALRVRVVR